MSKKFLIAVVMFSFYLGGCVTVEQATLPARQKKVYEYDTYSLQAPLSGEWRFLAENSQTQSLLFYHTKLEARVFVWVMPILSYYSQKEIDKSLVSYFLDKQLEEIRLSPDQILAEDTVEKGEREVDGRPYRYIAYAVDVKNKQFRTEIYYLIQEDEEVIYCVGVEYQIDNANKDEQKHLARGIFDRIILDREYKSFSSESLVELRVEYAREDFNSSVGDRYKDDKIEDLRKKYESAKKEANNFISYYPENYYGYFLLGEFYLFNDEMEKYGEGFDVYKAERNFKKSLSHREYFKATHESLARLYKETGRLDEAIEQYKLAVLSSPNSEDFHYRLGKLYEERGEKEEAKKSYENAVRFASDGFATIDEIKSKLKDWEK